MIKIPITYTGYDDEEYTEDWWFHISESDAAEMLMSHKGDFQAYLKTISTELDGAEIVKTFRDTVRRSVGRREGKVFNRDKHVADEFMQTPAYTAFFLRLIGDAEFAAKWYTGIFPANMQLAEYKPQLGSVENVPLIDPVNKKIYDMAELVALSDEDFDKVAGTDIREMSKEYAQAAFTRKWSHDKAA